MKTYTFYTDPGHGWIKVPMNELRTLNIAHKISHYSYRNGDLAYLEEDCDASLFIDAFKATGEEIAFTSVYQEHTPIRNYAHYCAEVIA
jgi:hypothetical protein